MYAEVETLRGQLLVAAPSLFDYFRRSVVLVIEHTNEGAMGVVLNRQSETRVAEAGTHVVGQLGTLDPESENGTLRRLRVYAGYAGWAPGQLDDELEQEAWVVVPARDDDPFSGPDVWTRALERRGGAYRLMATMPPDPS